MVASYRDPQPKVDQDLEEALIDVVEEGPEKPWVIVDRVASQEEIPESEAKNALRQLTIEGLITPTASDEVRLVSDRR